MKLHFESIEVSGDNELLDFGGSLVNLVYQIYEGTSEIQKLVISRHLDALEM